MTALIERCRESAIRLRVLCLAVSILAMASSSIAPLSRMAGSGERRYRRRSRPGSTDQAARARHHIGDRQSDDRRRPMQSNGLMVVTGKGYGVTNLIALDRNGATLMEKQVSVKGPLPTRSWFIAASRAKPIAARRFASRA